VIAGQPYNHTGKEKPMFGMRVLPWEPLERKVTMLRKLHVDEREITKAAAEHAEGRPYTVRMIELPEQKRAVGAEIV
jgi:hypothetical protein